MPETAIDKYSYSGVGEIEIWTPDYFLGVESPAAYASTHKSEAKSDLSGSIAFPFYGRHNVGAGRTHSGEVAVCEFRFKVAFH